ncbi:nitroreductase family protein [Heyndrickxia sporothermodurans]|uniref:nitroreductase family protein n=1 Tax=Heyndrickxia sporothermodurans TaxID=46224 RepID=UPI002E23B1F0|nr:nitroreductase family protein [Heyndrickxia sporothermodurans]MED3696816.1 nitroreductase family protein [Heyndrickxia sporothermodurans]MED3780643.1 nitroreductase family protein [Heyndrickxia sporothermodurans]
MAHCFWKELTVMSPVVDGNGGVLLSNPLTGQRVEVGINALMDLLAMQASKTENTLYIQEYLAEQGFLCEGDQIEPLSDLEHWKQRGWDQVLDYYLWSHVQPARQVNMPCTNPNRMTGINIQNLTAPIDLQEDLLLGEVILRRRTLRRYAEKPLAESLFSGLLWYGLSSLRSPVISRSEISHSFVAYVTIYAVKGVEPGLYRYYPDSHGLEPMVHGMLREQVSHLLFGQSAPLTAACTIFLAVDLFDYSYRHLGEGSLRGLFMEAGRLGHELLIAAGALGLGGLTAPALREQEAEQLLPVQKARETILYSLTLGEPQTLERRNDCGDSNASECSHTTDS